MSLPKFSTESDNEPCDGGHRYFVAEVIAVEGEGKAFLLALCTSCGNAFAREFKVSEGRSPVRLLLEEKTKKER